MKAARTVRWGGNGSLATGARPLPNTQYNKPNKTNKASNRSDPFLEDQLEEAQRIMGSGYDQSEVERYLQYTDDVALACYWAIKY